MVEDFSRHWSIPAWSVEDFSGCWRRLVFQESLSDESGCGCSKLEQPLLTADSPAVMEPADLVAAETNFQRDEQEQPSSMDAICPAEDSADQDVTSGLG